MIPLTKKEQKSILIRLHPSRSLLAKGALMEVERVLHDILPRWSRKLRARLDEWSREWFDASKPGQLDGAVRQVIRPGKTYEALVESCGTSLYDGELGAVTLTGDYRGVYIILIVNDWLFMQQPKQGGLIFGNDISIWVERKDVEGMPAAEWMSRAFATLCESMDFMYGFAYSNGELYSKNADERRGVGIGSYPSKHLPGLYWINFFGQPYVKLIGKNRLVTTPGVITKSTPTGVIVQFGNEPLAWRTRGYRTAIEKALDHIGRQYFFDRQAPNRKTVAPPFRFKSIERDKGLL